MVVAKTDIATTIVAVVVAKADVVAMVATKTDIATMIVAMVVAKADIATTIVTRCCQKDCHNDCRKD